MKCINFECKVQVDDLSQPEGILKSMNPKFIGEDYQMDTYFNVEKGRLKLRQGNIENALIYYMRGDQQSITQSDILLYRHKPDESLIEILTAIHGIKVIVEKKRRIYFLENVKFHFDQVKGLGTFAEIEAIDNEGQFTVNELKEQCDHFFKKLEYQKDQIVGKSYADMLAPS